MGELKRLNNLPGLLRFSEPTSELARLLFPSEQEQVAIERQIALTATLRQASLNGATVVAYASQLSRLDPTRYIPSDVYRALTKLANEPRSEYETAMPSLGELIERIEIERRLRLKPEAEAAAADRIAGYVAQAERERDQREAEWKRTAAERDERLRKAREVAEAVIAAAKERQVQTEGESGYLEGIA